MYLIFLDNFFEKLNLDLLRIYCPKFVFPVIIHSEIFKKQVLTTSSFLFWTKEKKFNNSSTNEAVIDFYNDMDRVAVGLSKNGNVIIDS